MPIAILVVALLLLAACDSYHAGFVNAGGASFATARSIDKAYAARDACLARNAATTGPVGSSATSRARTVALACAPETQRLIAVSNPGDSNAAAAIRDDSEFRAKGFVLRAQDRVAAGS